MMSCARRHTGATTVPTTTQPRLIPIAFVLVLLPSLVATGSTGATEMQTGTPAAAGGAGEVRSILEAASQRLAETNSLHFSLQVEGTTYIDDGRTIQLSSAEGDVVRPDKVKASFKAEIAGLAISTIELITVGDQSWTTNIITGDWEPAPTEFGYDATILFSDTEGLGYVMLNAVDPVLLPDEKLNDRDVYHIKTSGDAELIGPVTSDTMIGYPVGIDVWIDKETLDVVKVVLVEAETPEKDEPATWTIELSQQNDEMTIEPPDVGD
jgi:hypothetical protein